MSSASTLAVVVPLLEAMLDVACPDEGSPASLATRPVSRTELRVRLRKVTRVLRRDAGADGIEANSALEPESVPIEPGWSQARLSYFDHLKRILAKGASRVGDLLAQRPAPTKSVAVTDGAVVVYHHGCGSTCTAVMDMGLLRHNVPKTVAAKDQPRQRRAIERLCLALMHFVIGFFGSRKVDARNNP